MSDSNSLSILKGEINRLGFVSGEKISLLTHFTKNIEKIAVAVSCLDDFDTDENKRTYLRNLISSPEQPVADDLKSDLLRSDVDLLRTDLEEKFDLIRTDLGDIYELSARFEISKTRGSHYSSKFEVFDLNGLVRISLPKKALPSENAIYNSRLYIQSFRVNKLSNYIYKKGIRKKLNESLRYIRALPADESNYNKNLRKLADKADLALKKWTKYEGTAKSLTDNRVYLANTPELGIMIMTAYVMDAKIAFENNQAPFNYRLDIDLRGRTSGTDITDVTVELGEIKSSNAIKKGYRQLLLRLAVISHVIEAICSDEKEKELRKYNLFGKIYVPKTSNFNISPKWKEGIEFSSSANHHIDLIAVGEKQ